MSFSNFKIQNADMSKSQIVQFVKFKNAKFVNSEIRTSKHQEQNTIRKTHKNEQSTIQMLCAHNFPNLQNIDSQVCTNKMFNDDPMTCLSFIEIFW